MRKIFFTIVLFFLTLKGMSATYYCSPSGSDSNTGTIGSPFYSLNKAWTVIAAGDIVYLRGGTYSYTTQQSLSGKNGTSGALITIQNYPSEVPVLSRGTGYSATYGIYFSGNYFYWKGIEITGYTQQSGSDLSYGFRVENSSYNTFENLKVHGNGCGMTIVNNGYTLHATNNLVLNCDFYENQDPLTTGDPYGNADGLSIAWITHPEDVNTVRGCRFYWNSDDGFDMYMNDGMVVIENCQAFFNGYVPQTFTSAGDGNGFKFGTSTDQTRTTIKRQTKNCISVKNKRHGFDINDLYGGIQLYNCAAYQNVSIGIQLSTNNLIQYATNCWSYSNTINTALSSAGIHTTNSWQTSTVTDADFISIDTNLLLTTRQSDGSLPTTNFLKLASGSDLINVGTDIGISYYGTKPDLGAYEFYEEIPIIIRKNLSIGNKQIKIGRYILSL